jgi:PAS domain S-box-containing protein
VVKKFKNGYLYLTSKFIALHNIYIPALLFLVLFAIYNHHNEETIINSLKNDGTIINIAGRQRMLSQKLELLALEYYSEPSMQNKELLLKDIELINSSHSYLVNYFQLNVSGYKYKTANSDVYFYQYINELNSFAEDRNQTRLTKIKLQAKQLLLELTTLVHDFEIYNKSKIDNLENKQHILLLLFILFVILEIIFIFYPISKRIRDNTRYLEIKINQKTEELQKTLKLLSTYVIYSKTDKNGIITDVSDAFCTISGYKREELLGQNHNIVRHPDMPSSIFKELWRNIKKGNRFNTKIKNLKKDGSFYWVDAYIEPEYDEHGKIFSCISIREDITAKKIIEELNKDLQEKIDFEVKQRVTQHKTMIALVEEQKKYLSTVIESNNNAIIAIDKTKTILTYNKKAQEIFGFTQDEMLGTKNLLNIIPLRYKNIHKTACELYFNTGKSAGIISSTLELEGITKDERIIPIRISFGSSNGIVIANITDISKEKEQEKQLIEQSHLAQMGEMLSMISHQWRQPLASIGNASYSVQVKIRTGAFNLLDNQSIKNCIEYIEKKHTNINEYVQFLSTTIDDFRNFFKPNQKKELMELTLPIYKALQIIENSLRENNITIVKEFTTNTPLCIHKNEIVQVILNILNNAQDHFIENAIKDAKIVISTKEEGEYSIISISDNGGGIAENIIENIFNPYFSTKHAKNGTGLGLYMSKMIVDKHGSGELTAKNISGGVVFEIKLRKECDCK